MNGLLVDKNHEYNMQQWRN